MLAQGRGVGVNDTCTAEAVGCDLDKTSHAVLPTKTPMTTVSQSIFLAKAAIAASHYGILFFQKPGHEVVAGLSSAFQPSR